MSYKIGSCRGDERKRTICNECYVKPISRMRLLPGHSIEGCCGDLENEHTIFYFKHKQSGDEGTFSVGRDCANSFLSILGQQSPPLVDPLQNLSTISAAIVPPPKGTNGGVASTGSNPIAQAIPAINSELYVAINLWCILVNTVPKYALQRILKEIQESPFIALKDKDVFEFLKVVASYKKSLRTLLLEAQAKHPSISIKNFSFPAINQIASQNWIDLP